MAIVFITGTSSGIGLATAVTLAESGHTVYAGMRNRQKFQDLQRIATDKNLKAHGGEIKVKSSEGNGA